MNEKVEKKTVFPDSVKIQEWICEYMQDAIDPTYVEGLADFLAERIGKK